MSEARVYEDEKHVVKSMEAGMYAYMHSTMQSIVHASTPRYLDGTPIPESHHQCLYTIPPCATQFTHTTAADRAKEKKEDSESIEI